MMQETKMTHQDILDALKVQKMRILQEFPFESAAEGFKHFGHKWITDQSPTSDQLFTIASVLLDTAIDEYKTTRKPTRTSTGRFMAFVHVWPESVELELSYSPFDLSCFISSN